VASLKRGKLLGGRGGTGQVSGGITVFQGIRIQVERGMLSRRKKVVDIKEEYVDGGGSGSLKSRRSEADVRSGGGLKNRREIKK